MNTDKTSLEWHVPIALSTVRSIEGVICVHLCSSLSSVFQRFTASASLVASTFVAPALAADKPPPVPTLDRARAIAEQRCVPCHTPMPTVRGLYSPPNGVVLEKPAELKRHAERIAERVASGAMPPENATGMTDEERAQLVAWARAARKAR